jgi:triacylglycerol lipase
MFHQTDQNRGGRQADRVSLQVDPPIASSDWILLRGRLSAPAAAPARRWPFLARRAVLVPVEPAAKLTVRLPDRDDECPVETGPSGSFELRIAVQLPRLRATQRPVVFCVERNGESFSRSVPLFMPAPGATRAVIVLADSADEEPATRLRLSEMSQTLIEQSRSRGVGVEPNPVFYVVGCASGPEATAAGIAGFSPQSLAIEAPGDATTAAVAGERAAWIARIVELYGHELDFVVVADSTRASIAAVQTLARQPAVAGRLRAVFVSDTRPVARGVRLQLSSPPGLSDLALPIVLCRTLTDASKAAEQFAAIDPHVQVAVPQLAQPRVQATHARVTRQPIVFCHGMLGYSVLRLRNVDLNNYFNGLRERLTEQGFRVLMPQLGRTHSVAQRAEQLRRSIGRWTTEPVNIVAHSMGGLDARFMITKLDMADRVVSLTTIASPHHGTYFADWFVDRFDGRFSFLSSLERLGLEVNGFRAVTRASCRVFNVETPNSPRVRYFSYSAFQVARKIPPVLRRAHSLIARTEGSNDGLVSERSAHWGEHVATLRTDHLSLVGEKGPEYFDHLSFYSRIVQDLIRCGF